MNSKKEKDGGARRRSRQSQGSKDTDQSRPSSKRKRPPSPELGTALRSVYQQTIDENIPPEMLDLLGKLG